MATEARAVLDSSAVPHILSKEFEGRLGIEPDKTKRRITAVTGEKSPLVGMLKYVPVSLDEKDVKLNFVVVKGSPYDVTVGNPTMESLERMLDLEHHVASFVVDGDKIEIPMHLDYVPEDPHYKAGTDTEDFTSATTTGGSEEGDDTD